MKSSVWFLKGAVYFAALSSSLALAGSSGGHELGNGGDVFVCPGNKVEMVDVYEARIAGRKIEIGPEGVDYKAKLQSVFKKWSQVSPLRMKRYQAWLDSFESESRFIPDSSLPNVGDEGIISIPQGCEIRQVAIQLADQDLGSFYKRYTITKDLWDRMDESNRAALVLHELIFREAIATGHRVSLRVRYLNGILLSSSSIDEYVNAGIALNGMFLEWGWGGLERVESDYSDPMNYELTADTFGWQSKYVEVEAFWLGAESFNLTYNHKASDGTCIVRGEVRRNDMRRFIFVNRGGSCLLTGKVLYIPDAQGSMSVFNETKIENQNSPVQISFDEFHETGFLISGLSSTAQVSEHSEWSDSKYSTKMDLNCIGLSSIKKYPNNWYFSGRSESGVGQCLAKRAQVSLNGGAKQEDSYSFQSFHLLSIDRTSHFVQWLKILEFDGTQSAETDFQFGPTSVKCEQNPKDPSGYLNCKGIPAELACEIPVIDSVQGIVRTRSEKVKLADPSQLRRLRASEGDKVQETFEVLAPTGQVYRYNQGFLKDNPQNLDRTAWMSLRFESGKCVVTGEYHGL
ncbi:MAG: hypothetical protein ACJ763_19490 [Bdellovibrionia bacterium]